jgi:hypothetical protein
MSDQDEDRVAKWLRKSGFPLEMRLAAEWEKAGFDVSQSVYYVDPETATARETDIVASKDNLTKDAWLRFFCVVECKSGREPWVLFSRRGASPNPRSRIQSLAVSPLTAPYLSRISSRSDIAALPIFTSTMRPAYGMVQASSDTRDHAYAALMSVSKAAAVLLEQLGQNSEGEESFELVWPLIVTEAPLFEAQLSADGEVAIQSVKRGTLMWRHPTAGRGIRAIDVVHSDAAADFIGEIKTAVDLILWNTEGEASKAITKRREHAAKLRPPTA